MRTKFDILLQVVFEHDFFKDKCMKGLEIRPTENTAKLLRDFGLLFKRVKKGFIVLYEIDTSASPEKPLKPVQTEIRLSFEIYMNEAWFVNYSDLPLDHRLPKFFYFDNLTHNEVNNELLLSKQASAGTNDITVLIGDIENIDIPAPAVSSLIEVVDLKNRTTFSKTVLQQTDETTNEKRLIYQLDFNKIGTGKYDIKIDGSLHKQVYSDKVLYRKPVFGIIDIHASTGVPAANRFVTADGAVNKKTYKIRFSQRRTFWKYFLVLNNIGANPEPSIIYSDPASGSDEEVYPSAVTFEPPATLTGADTEFINSHSGKTVLLFQSSDKMPFYEIPKKKISLIKPHEPDEDEEDDDTGDDTSDEDAVTHDIVIENLPNAAISAIKPNTSNTESFSEIFIYV